MTLIALANGAGDVVTAIVASGSADGVAYNIGALFGAGLFVCTIVMTFTITGYKDPNNEGKWGPITVSKNTIHRDMPFYIVTVAFVVFCGIYGEITWWTSSIMLFLYVALVIVVYIQGRSEEKPKDDDKPAEKKSGEVELTNKDDGASKPLLGDLAALKESHPDNEAKEEKLGAMKAMGMSRMMMKMGSGVLARIEKKSPNIFSERKKAKEAIAKKPAEHMSCCEKIMCCIDFPFKWIRKLTILPCELENYD